MELTSILGFALIATLLSLLLAQYKPEYAMMVATAAGAFLFLKVLGDVLSSLLDLQEMLQSAGVEVAYFRIAFKALGICYIAQFVSDLCRDFGQTSIAGRVELAGKCAVLVLSLPLLQQLIELSISFLK